MRKQNLKTKNTQLATCRSNVTKAIAQLKDAKARSGRKTIKNLMEMVPLNSDY